MDVCVCFVYCHCEWKLELVSICLTFFSLLLFRQSRIVRVDFSSHRPHILDSTSVVESSFQDGLGSSLLPVSSPPSQSPVVFPPRYNPKPSPSNLRGEGQREKEKKRRGIQRSKPLSLSLSYTKKPRCSLFHKSYETANKKKGDERNATTT